MPVTDLRGRKDDPLDRIADVLERMELRDNNIVVRLLNEVKAGQARIETKVDALLSGDPAEVAAIRAETARLKAANDAVEQKLD